MDNAPATPPPAPAAPAEMPEVGEILTAATGVTFDNAGLLFGVWACTHAPVYVLGLILQTAGVLTDKDSIKNALLNQEYGILAGLAAAGLVGLVTGILAYASTVLLTVYAYRGKNITLATLLTDGLGRMWSLAVASLLIFFAIGAWIVFLIFPGAYSAIHAPSTLMQVSIGIVTFGLAIAAFYLLFRLSLTSYATCAEEMGPMDAIQRSWKLTAGNFWKIMVFVAIFFLILIFSKTVVRITTIFLWLTKPIITLAGVGLAGVVINSVEFIVSAWGTALMARFYLELADRTPRA